MTCWPSTSISAIPRTAYPSIEQPQATLTAQVVALDKSIAGIELEQREVAETLADKEAEHTAWNAGFVHAQEEFGTASAEFRQGETVLQASERLVARLRALPDKPVAQAEPPAWRPLHRASSRHVRRSAA